MAGGGSSFQKVGNSGGPEGRPPAIRGRGSRRLATWGALVVAVPVLGVGFVAGPAGAGTVGQVSNFPGGGTSAPYGVTAGPNGSLWFANSGNNSIDFDFALASVLFIHGFQHEFAVPMLKSVRLLSCEHFNSFAAVHFGYKLGQLGRI